MQLNKLKKINKKSHHGRFGGFKNPHIKNIRRSALDAVMWFTGFYKDKLPLEKIPDNFYYPNPKMVVNPNEPTVTWINHSSYYIQAEGKGFLTDPVWSKRCSPVGFVGPKRQHEPGIKIEDIPFLDYVLVSHNHYDHLDAKAVRELNKLFPKATWMVPLGLVKWFKVRGVKNIIEKDWWDTHENGPFNFTNVPTQHFSGRSLFDKNRTLWSGWVVEINRESKEKKTLYFVGDTGYNKIDFKSIGQKFDKIDLSLVPIGVYTPTKLMDTVHICPKHAVEIHKEVGSKLSVATHWNTFRLSEEPMNYPPYDLFKAMQKSSLPLETFRILEPGQSINW